MGPGTVNARASGSLSCKKDAGLIFYNRPSEHSVSAKPPLASCRVEGKSEVMLEVASTRAKTAGLPTAIPVSWAVLVHRRCSLNVRWPIRRSDRLPLPACSPAVLTSSFCVAAFPPAVPSFRNVPSPDIYMALPLLLSGFYPHTMPSASFFLMRESKMGCSFILYPLILLYLTYINLI